MKHAQLPRKQRRIVLALTASTLLGACAYRMDIQQGNHLDADTVAQVQEGMTRKQVRFLLGTPMIPDSFDKERWDYLYYFKRGRWRTPQQRHLIVYFGNDKVTKFDRLNVPENSPNEPPQQKQAPIAKFPRG